MEATPAAGENIAVLRIARGLTQVALARKAQISVSLLRKIESGVRAATPPNVATLAKALHVTTARIYGSPFPDPSEQRDLLNELRGAVRRHTLPRVDVPDPAELDEALKNAAVLRADAKYLELLRGLPRLLGQVTAVALTAGGDATAWGNVADVYGCAYAVAHRLGEPDLAENIVSRQTWAAQQTWNPTAEAAAAWNEAGTYQSAGDYGDGLAIVDRAITKFESVSADAPGSLVALGALHLRGVVLASRAKDKSATREHSERAHRLSERLDTDILLHNLTFGPGNTAFYDLAAKVELDQPDQAVAMAERYVNKPPRDLRPSRVGRLYIDASRAYLALGKHQKSEEMLERAFAVAPQMTEVHPMAREVLRVLFISHQRARPALLSMAKKAGLAE